MTEETSVLGEPGVGMGVEVNQGHLAEPVDTGHPQGVGPGDGVIAAQDDRDLSGPGNIGDDIGDSFDRALQLAQTAVSVAPERPEIVDTLGWVYYKRNQPRQAILYFQQCIEKSPTVAEYHYHLGLALVKAGDQPGGRASLKRALDLKPNAAIAAEIRKALEGIAN